MDKHSVEPKEHQRAQKKAVPMGRWAHWWAHRMALRLAGKRERLARCWAERTATRMVHSWGWWALLTAEWMGKNSADRMASESAGRWGLRWVD